MVIENVENIVGKEETSIVSLSHDLSIKFWGHIYFVSCDWLILLLTSIEIICRIIWKELILKAMFQFVDQRSLNPFPNGKGLQMTISTLMKMAKFFKMLENTVGKGEIARYEQFLLFPPCFQKACFPGASIAGNCRTRSINLLPNNKLSDSGPN